MLQGDGLLNRDGLPEGMRSLLPFLLSNHSCWLLKSVIRYRNLAEFHVYAFLYQPGCGAFACPSYWCWLGSNNKLGCFITPPAAEAFGSVLRCRTHQRWQSNGNRLHPAWGACCLSGFSPFLVGDCRFALHQVTQVYQVTQVTYSTKMVMWCSHKYHTEYMHCMASVRHLPHVISCGRPLNMILMMVQRQDICSQLLCLNFAIGSEWATCCTATSWLVDILMTSASPWSSLKPSPKAITLVLDTSFSWFLSSGVCMPLGWIAV